MSFDLKLFLLRKERLYCNCINNPPLARHATTKLVNTSMTIATRHMKAGNVIQHLVLSETSLGLT